ncbi:hypothetical protein DAPPUDRAFT_259439 [Daphnia pulex]|uniref:Uncharacterized protein n=1 Tax=Daphnia pulex TaxID=6669 RepID=E9HH84_DAPPU|nr:hypothetical protein DAPPUDRAFT_259439 [Daphnia pulex]|eukprot:EFX68898.1 hypothetical protein DAPPUDRAFT_259439 [Daphnia pulex]
MSQNIIFAAIKVVKSWDDPQYMSLGKDQRDAILKRLTKTPKSFCNREILHFHEAHSDLSNWQDEIEEALTNADDPAIQLKQIDRQQEVNKLLMSEISEYKTNFEKLNKTGSTLAQLCLEEEGVKVHDIIELHNARMLLCDQVCENGEKPLKRLCKDESIMSTL